jgi:UDP-glucose 4-epimerase
MIRVLLTGGAGYIGSHTYAALAEKGYHAVILDNFSNSNKAVIGRLELITKTAVPYEIGNVTNTQLVKSLIEGYQINAVIHFAGFKAVGESVTHPLKYYANNVGGMISLLEALSTTKCRNLVFSSSATVYGDPEKVPINELSPMRSTNPYGHTKLVCEQILSKIADSDPLWRIGVLRYFNPIGAHSSGLIGEDPAGLPNNLLPYVTQVAIGKLPHLNVYGKDYPTPDGTGVRDYIHVQDLALGHIAAIEALNENGKGFTVNLGTGHGHSVLEVVRTMERASGRSVTCQFRPRRAGDVSQCYADPSLAHRLLNWRATRSLAAMCNDAWNWQLKNPNGYYNH